MNLLQIIINSLDQNIAQLQEENKSLQKKLEAALAEKASGAMDGLIDEFVEDFKAQAPIWKYDIIKGERIYAEDRSTAIKGSGLLS